MSIKIALSYPRAEIFQMYADVAYFGHGYYGLAAASCGYFAIPPSALSWQQAALLAGLVQAPSADDPLRHLTVARARQAVVLGRLAATGTLTARRPSVPTGSRFTSSPGAAGPALVSGAGGGAALPARTGLGRRICSLARSACFGQVCMFWPESPG